jgi:hypothetical protein
VLWSEARTSTSQTGSQLSVAVGSVNIGTPWQEIVSSGAHSISGAIESISVTVW